jgi:Flp pilus assembly pilin Flp
MSGSMKMLHSARSIAIRLWKDERGASLLEYAVLLGLIVAASAAAVIALGTTTNTFFTKFKDSFGTNVPSEIK